MWWGLSKRGEFEMAGRSTGRESLSVGLQSTAGAAKVHGAAKVNGARRAVTRRKSPQHGDAGVGGRVRSARKQRGLSGTALGEVLGLDKTQVSKIEADTRRISAEEMPKLAEALRVTPQWLMGMQASSPLVLAHRLHGAADVARSQARAADVLRVEDALARHDVVQPLTASAVGQEVIDQIRSEFPRAPRSRAEAQRQGRRMAEIVRSDLDLGIDEIGDLADLIEMHFATDVVLSPLGLDADGLCAHGEGRAVIVASSSFDQGHVRFTLAHELGHHLLGDAREVIDEPLVAPHEGTLVERRVSAFAAHLLIPAAGVSAMLEWLSASRAEFERGSRRAMRAAASVVIRYGASPMATIYQLADLGYVADPKPWLSAFVGYKGTATLTSPVVRPPRRLLEAAIEAAAARKISTGPLSVLLEREDEDNLYLEFVERDSLLPR